MLRRGNLTVLWTLCGLGGLAVLRAGAAEPAAVKLEQIVSREDVHFNCRSAVMTAGRDGKLYFSCVGHDLGFVLRASLDGKEKYGKKIVYAIANVTANADGVVASANGHFAHKVTLYDKELEQTGQLADFLVSDSAGWDAPAHVEAGASGDFYGVDQHRGRIVRLSPGAKVVRIYPIPNEPADNNGKIQSIRVCEKQEAFYLQTRSGGLRCAGFDGKTRWKAAASSGAFDCDDEGNLYVLQGGSDSVKRFGKDGAALPDVKLKLGENRPGPGQPWFNAVRIVGKNVVVRREHERELFQCYDLESGAFKQAARIDHERFAVSFPSAVWTAGQAVPVTLQFDAGGRNVKPRWRVWARPLESLDYREFKLAGDQFEVPADAAGLYRIKVTPEATPWERGGPAQIPSEYLLQAVVEIRAPEAKGAVAVFTPENRMYYGQGEAIPLCVALRGAESASVKVTLTGPGGTVGETTVAAKSGAPAALTIPAQITAALRPGEYVLTAAASGLTCVPQRLVVGAALREPSFFITRYGDYGAVYPSHHSPWNAPDVVAAHLERTRRLGLNLMVDRLGWDMYCNDLWWQNPGKPELDALAKRLSADAGGLPPEKAKLLPPLQQVLAGYGAYGIHEMAILMMNDAGLPLGTGFDRRKPDQILAMLKKVMSGVQAYPSFRGWSWSSNWWVFDKRGASAAKDAQEKTAYNAALKQVKETGAWAPVLDEVAARRLGFAVDAQELFNKTLKECAPEGKYVTASAAPYRNVESYPPITFKNVDEVDLHIQWEQIGVPYHSAHNVDFYKRPGKRGWAHPEVWNDDGTGGQVLPALFQIAMRGGDGVGFSGDLPPWAGVGGGLPDDPRTPHYGWASVFRALSGLLRPYGPLFAALENDDRVAIAASGRMYKLDDWCHVTGLHFARELEAYISCLHAHHPARIIFAEDVKPDSFKPFKAVLVVDQRYEFEPELLAALKAAQAAGTKVYVDGTCRESLVKDFTPLGISFNKLEKDRSPAGDDAAYWRFAGYAKANLPALSKALDAATPPAARVDDDEVLISQRRGGEGRYLWVLNNTLPRLDPGLIWRMTLGLTQRVPLVIPVSPGSNGKPVYDVFAGKQVTPEGGAVQADLRSLPARLYAILPAPIAQIELKAPPAAKAGQRLAWQIRVQDAAGQTIPAPIPVRVRLLGADGSVLAEQFAAAGAQGAADTFAAPVNAPKASVTVEATELLSGRTAALSLAVAPAALTVFAANGGGPAAKEAPAEASASAKGKEAVNADPPDAAFGPHVRDLVITDGGKLAVMNTMNWDHNLYAVDVETGQTRWRQRVGQYFAFEPCALKDGVAVQGFDFRSAAGYHLYLAGNDGKLERRFALYGLPGRLPHRFVPAIMRDRLNHFAVPEDGSWVAAAGDLGLAVWSRDGKPLWTQDWWKQTRHTATLAALDAKTLLVVEGLKAQGVSAADGKKLWETTLATMGEVTEALVSSDGKTVALLATTEGGKVFVLRGGKVERALPTPCADAALNGDGSLIAVAAGNQLKLYSLADGLQWTFNGDDRVRFPRFAPDGKRVVATSDLGSAYVLDAGGNVLWEKDLGARAAPAWLPGGDLVFGTCQGTAWRFGGDYKERWRTRLTPAEPDMREKLLADDGAPTAKVTSWTNSEPAPRGLEPNLLAQRPIIAKFVPTGQWGGFAQFAHDPKLLADGKADAPPSPWVDWSFVGFFAETSPVNYVLVDAYRTQLRVEAVTLFEDAAHPESWLRDVRFDYWDAAKEVWVPVQTLLSDAPVHTHKFAKPVEAARFRFYLPWGVVGNLRLGEIVFHGEALGCSHPDAAAKRPVAVLFDEQDEFKGCMQAWGQKINFKFDGAYSGGRCVSLPSNAKVGAEWQPPIGHFVPNWDFEIVENPQPGQYRYLQFAWKMSAPGTKGITLGFGGQNTPLICLSTGTATKLGEGGEAQKQLGTEAPAEWRVERVDLWALLKKPGRIQTVSFGTSGGGALVDQILLGRTEKDLVDFKANGTAAKAETVKSAAPKR
jgi:outer membrane protein assembly factor BamB